MRGYRVTFWNSTMNFDRVLENGGCRTIGDILLHRMCGGGARIGKYDQMGFQMAGSPLKSLDNKLALS